MFLDFSRAFDRVPHIRLIVKLNNLNIHPIIVKWISSFLTYHSQHIVVSDVSSPSRHVASGVLQGSVLGPLLFLIYTSKFPECISSNIRLFSNDCVIYSATLDKNGHLLLQNDVSLINNWCNKWQMSLNLEKCKVISFSCLALPTDYRYHLKDVPFIYTSNYKYIPIHLTSGLSWSFLIQQIIASANKTLGYRRRNLKLTTPHVKHLTYITLVRQKLEFSSSIWIPW